MRTNESDGAIVLQPETDIEQSLLSELFTRLNNITEARGHPDKVGSLLCYYTLDLAEYRGLDHDLWAEAKCRVNENGMLDPEPGSRALVVVHDPEVEYAEELEADAEGASDEEVEDAVEEAEDDGAEEDESEEAEAEPVIGEPPFNPEAWTVSEIETALSENAYTPAELRALYNAEGNSKARKTALEAIEDALDAETEEAEEVAA